MMKKLLLIVAVSSVLASATAIAANDIPATLNISGSVQDSTGSCAIELSRSLVHLPNQDVASLPEQGTFLPDAVARDAVSAMLTGSNCSGVALNFIGNAAGDGSALSNADEGSAAAKGVGVGIYDAAGEIITPNVSSRYVMPGVSSYPFHLAMVKLKNQSPAPGSVQSSLTVQIDRM
ncbi:type 1 fimbrial protein [Cronobacter muytjensii]|uniref:Type 1 fimbrial protein n=2 Tax=Cronobacter muytjensii TaxID=413501 RepID=A0A2T7AVT3_9ENTR|nr:fimbrial protein [Cronobacter muytjensii]EGT4340191.1 type 1 fimbrial protein [Cronobacter muytjensii]ELY4517979.1 type 1 fimbrial protein [Cronobacter muytjensii]KAB0878765.1 type 1 fimbrial protein [Cronobacter muytjensii]PUX16212.1 type 1 fimbrial protein [Cronobacter muytjensii]